MRINNLKYQKKFRKYLRNNATKAEIILWSYLKGKQLDNYKFRRQHGIGKYIVDFYCPEIKLAIELDGNIHLKENVIRKDILREHYLNNLGIEILRFDNSYVINNIGYVLTRIENVSNQRKELF